MLTIVKQKNANYCQTKKRKLSNRTSKLAKLKVNQHSPPAYHENLDVKQMVCQFDNVSLLCL